MAAPYSTLIASDVIYASSFQRPPSSPDGGNVTDAAIIAVGLGDLARARRTRRQSSNGLWIDSVRDAGKANRAQEGAIGTSIDGVTANGTQLTPGTTVTTVKLRIPSTFVGHGRQPRQLPGARHRGAPHRGQRAHAEQAVKSLLPSEPSASRSPPPAIPGEVKVDVAVPTVAGEKSADNNHYTYHVAFQA